MTFPENTAQSLPVQPRPAVSAAIFRDGDILLAQRARQPARGLWSLPGGHMEPGETAEKAAERELREETGVSASFLGVCAVHDVVQQNDRGLVIFHKVIIVFCGFWASGIPKAGSDAMDTKWHSPSVLADLPRTEGLDAIVTRAAAMLEYYAA